MSTDESDTSLPRMPPDSPGSSVSTRLQEEYEELLKYAVIVPNYDPKALPQKITDVHESFAEMKIQQQEQQRGGDLQEKHDAEESEGSLTPRQPLEPGKSRLPDFGQSPVQKHSADECTDVSQEQDNRDKWKVGARPPFLQMLHDDSEDKESEDSVKETIYTATIDPDVGRMENLLDQWCLDLKRNVLAELGQSKIRIVELGRKELKKERERFAAEKNELLDEANNLKELLHTYEQSIERKDQVISNMTHAMQKQRERLDMNKRFCEWRMRHNDKKREEFSSNLARRHYKCTLMQKVWRAWFSIIEHKWRHRVEKACQSKAQEVCIKLTNDYEAKISALTEALEKAQQEVSRLHRERERYEEAMKKAFMRGVCALNLEAMTMFHEQDQEDEQVLTNGRSQSPHDFTENLNGSLPEKEFGKPKTIPQEPIYTSETLEPPPPRVVTTQGSRSSTATVSQAKSASSKMSTTAGRGKHVSARITGRADSSKAGRGLGTNQGLTTLGPPMASVIVERHQPVTKQTIGHATASKFPRPHTPTDTTGGIVYRRLAGQSGPVTVTPNIQSVKVVD